MRGYFFLGLNFAIIVACLWLHDRARVWLAGRLGDRDAAARQRSPENPFARVDWVGSVALPAFLLFRHSPLLGWTKPIDLDADRLRRPRRDGLLIALAGPVANLLLAAAGIGLVRLLGAAVTRSQLLMQVLPPFCQANACIAAFNLLPIPPLAMSHAAEVLLDGDALTAFEEIKPYGFLLILAGVYFNFFDFITQPVSQLVYSLLGF